MKEFSGGDFHFIDDMLGHQGSGSTFPSSIDLVTLDHLWNHGGHPHTPETCSVELRSVDDYQLNYNENLCDDRCHGNMRENGKHHNSVIEKMLFCIKDLRFVVPPVLHILLGITLYLYNVLLGYCQQLDKEEIGYGEENGDMEVSNEWLDVSLLLSERNEKLHKLGEELVEIENQIGRIDAVVKGELMIISV